ncbi:MAG: guanylate kinase [Bacteroidales bacterium]|jgi:guanylate kinase|nr:guanylate kinase [Bacteroidales bacterium]MBO7180516.1 guanylate kinase [Bacteroidales bacterium]MBO7229409.1 guanylate kinase [Bacteroidales bacterium]MBQ2386638.1 guanylate kinase [Bacteroidales bacterium]MEE0895235.1 guanylate kinase [Bacteroidales bacterium]
MKGVFIFSAPSGSGKTTILKQIFEKFPNLFGFSVSATNRPARDGEIDGRDYYFLSDNQMKEKIANGDFLEWEQVYEGRYYGTLKSELDRIWSEGKVVVFDVDVKGGINIKNMLKDEAFAIFIMPPSVEELKKRLEGRNTETAESLQQRLARAEMEISKSDNFDTVILNDDLTLAVNEVEKCIGEQLRKWDILK